MATLGAALMAECGRSGSYSGAKVLAAIVAGADVSLNLGVAATTPLKFFRPATSGLFGAIAGVARLKGLSRETTLDAFGYGLGFASGTMQAHQEGKPALPVQIANAARAALMAVDVAAAGLPGPRRSLDGDFGYMTLFETAFDFAPVLATLGQTFRITEVSWKPFPTGRAGHGGIVAIQRLMADHGVTTENLEQLTWRAPPLIHRLVGRPAVQPMTPAYARLCLPYLAAVTLTRGTVGLGDFGPDSLSDPGLQQLAERVTVVADDNPEPAAFVPAEAVARLRDGREVRAAVTTQLGSPAWPLTRDQHLEKARACLAFADLDHVHAPLSALFDRFETLEDAGQVFRLAAGEI
jgi:2-methylcitrate dehydratase PrpD